MQQLCSGGQRPRLPVLLHIRLLDALCRRVLVRLVAGGGVDVGRDDVRIAPVLYCGTYALCSRARERSRWTAMEYNVNCLDLPKYFDDRYYLIYCFEDRNRQPSFLFPKGKMGARSLVFIDATTRPMLQRVPC